MAPAGIPAAAGIAVVLHGDATLEKPLYEPALLPAL